MSSLNRLQAPSIAAFLLLFFTIVFVTVATFFLPDPYSIKILAAQHALDWNDVLLFTIVGLGLIAVAAFFLFSALVGMVRGKHML